MKYIAIDYKNGDMFTDEFETAEEAIAFADKSWNRLSDYDKQNRDEFYVLESANPDEDAPDHFDGNEIKRYK